MKLIVKGPVGRERIETLTAALRTDWTVDVWSPGDDAEILLDADALIAMNWRGDVPATPNLKLLQIPGAGYDGVGFDRLPLDCWVCNVFEHEIPIAEYCMLAMLEWNIGLRTMDRNLRQGAWTGSFFGAGGVRLHGELAGKTLAILGYGHIGRELAKRAKAFGVRVFACTRSPEKCDRHVDRAVGTDRLADVLTDCDFLVVACPLTEATRGLIGTAEFALMKDSAVIVNVARGAVVDEKALYDACADGAIAGAVIDVWYSYPPNPGDVTMPSRLPFHQLDNVILSPHSSGLGEGLLDRRWTAMAASLDDLARGDAPANVLRAPGGPTPE
jgi:phosphoglycerate dehydrogenase-like enzyme